MLSAPLAPSGRSTKQVKTTNYTPPKNIQAENKENDGIDRFKNDCPGVCSRAASAPALLPPKTPARITLSDLTANPEDIYNQLPPLGTPNDHVTWKHVPGSGHTPSSSVKTTQRGIKRARSSSPPSSQGIKSKHFRPNEDALNMQSLSQSLRQSPTRRSPNHDDPAAALWNSYTERRGNEPVLPPMLPLDPSPRTPIDTKRDSSFRRVHSCTNEWPSSSAKKRRLEQRDPHSTTKDIFATRKIDIMRRETAKQTRVNVLLESVQQSMVGRKRESDGPASSSPLPERSHFHGNFTETSDIGVITKYQQNLQPYSPIRRKFDDTNNKDASSDYGDLDLDANELDALENTLTQGTSQQADLKAKQDIGTELQTTNQRSQTQNAATVQMDPDQSNEHVTKHVKSNPDTSVDRTPASIEVKDGFGEFDEADDEILDSELQELAAKVDSQGMSVGRTTDISTNSHFVPRPVVSEFDGAFDDDNDYDDDLWKEIDDVKISGTVGNASSTNQKIADNRAIKRYLIIDHFVNTYEISPGRKRPQKVLSIKDEKLKHIYTLLLRDSWYDTRCTKGSYVHLIGSFDYTGQCIVDDKDNMLILHPDHLISATVVGDAITCLRRATLQDRVKATSPATEPQVYGHILHEVFGEALKQNNWQMENFHKIIESLIPNYLESLYEIGVQVPTAIEHLMSKVPLLKAWAEIFVSQTPLTDAVIRDRKGTLVPTAINKLLELEEHVWSPMYGLKGNIDATVQAQLQLPGEKLPRTLLVPLELKTGIKDSSDSHRAQTALYTLLLSDRYDVNVTSGILYYLETSKTFRIEAVRNEIRQMIIWRNELACYVHDKLDLPPMIKKEYLCKRCYAQTSCFTYHKLVEDGNGETSGMKEVFDDAVAHLKPIHQDFFRKWDELLTKEERDCMKFKRELWTMLSTERERVGRCFANVKIEPGSSVEHHGSSKINRFSYSFIKHKSQPGFLFTESQIAVGEPIVISDEKGHFALANGFVTHVRPTRISVAVDRRLQPSRKRAPNFDAQINQSFAGLMEVKIDTPPFVPSPTNGEEPTLYRIDKDEFSNGMATVRNNLVRIMESGLFRAKELRQLIIERKAPCFKPASTAYTLSGPASQQGLNVDQIAAIEKVMSAKDYALILGMPGTGKTTTIAHIIRALVSQGKSVLLTSYTHTAVDNILLKIKGDNIPILRLGSVGKVHPEVQKFADLSGIPKKSMEELERSWSQSKVVATTCLSINHGIFNHRVFDYCIVDEASQITLPVCLGPIRFAHAFILVGDHYQLPPLVQNKEAQEGGLDISLFKLLSDDQPGAVVNLEHQYRMAQDIMLLSNRLIYSGRLKCGTETIASRSLPIPSLETGLEAHHHSSSSYLVGSCSINNRDCWIRKSLHPSARALFLNTDKITKPTPATERVSGVRITNQTESLLTAQLLTVLIRAGVPPRQIGVITFYRSQLALLRRDVKATAGTAAASEVEMHTADKYQGRDKEVILLSCVRSNSNRHVGDLLRDWRRVNVAITRARSKLLIIGSRQTMEASGVEVLEGLVKIMDGRGWMINLPTAATEGHAFEVAVSQTQAPPTLTDAKQSSTSEINARVPLKTVNANVVGKRVQQTIKHPSKIVRGMMDVENLLDKRPIMRDLAHEFASFEEDFETSDF